MSQTHEHHPLIRAVAKLKRIEPPEGHILCPECDGFRLVLKTAEDGSSYFEVCTVCRPHAGPWEPRGYIVPCPHCGRNCDNGRRGSDCEASREARRERENADYERRQLTAWRTAEPLPWTEGPDLPGMPAAYSDRLEREVDEEDIEDAWREHCGEPDEPPPIDPEWALLYAMKPIRFRFNAESVAECLNDEWGCDDWYPAGAVPEAAWGALQELLDAWCKEHVDGIGWAPDTTKPLLPPEREA